MNPALPELPALPTPRSRRRTARRLPRWTALCLAGMLAAAGCTASAPPGGAVTGRAPDGGPADPLAVALDRAIGSARCDSDAQCRTVAVGHSACGGPAGYRAWSVLGTDGAAVQRAAEALTTRQAAQQQRSGVMGMCVFIADPGAVCRAPAPGAAGRCVLGQGEQTSHAAATARARR